MDTANCGHYAGDKDTYFVDQMMAGYHQFKEYARIYYPDVYIISVNPVGLRGLFEDVYTKDFLDAHPEIEKENLKIL